MVLLGGWNVVVGMDGLVLFLDNIEKRKLDWERMEVWMRRSAIVMDILKYSLINLNRLISLREVPPDSKNVFSSSCIEYSNISSQSFFTALFTFSNL